MMNKLLLIILISFIFCENEIDTTSIIDTTVIKKVINHDWKLNVFSIGKGMIPIGQFENNKPFKAIALMTMKFYWLKEFNIAKDISNISDRNRSFWWLLMLNLYGIVDSYVDFHLKDFPDNDIDNKKEEK